ncbi:serine hydrolase [Kitasatospora sp. NPDC089913]|uniref:serine hydrolase n=1 Tax=Kitasatospora sp. NPDC089913 TaxID=3364080 RepID=UPI0037FFFB5A
MKHRTALAVPLLVGAAMAAHVLLPAAGPAKSAASAPLPASTSSAPSAPSALSAAGTPSAPGAPSGQPSTNAAATTPQQAVKLALDGIGAHHGRFAVAVEDLTSGRSAAYGPPSETFASASIVKVDILAALLLQAQDRGEQLGAAQRQLASDMIRVSDNDAAQKLWTDIGRRQGLDAANARLGLTAAHAGQTAPWGLTRTTTGDQISLLKAVFTQDSPLNAASRAYARTLMSTVTDEQNWGISAAATPGNPPALKNGWLPTGTAQSWTVNSIGTVEHDGHTLLVAVLTDGQPTQRAGITLAEQTAATAVEALLRIP